MIQIPSVGDTWGRYRLVRELGRGGMGVVYAARDESLGREVAVKIIVPHLAGDDEHRARFEREAMALSRVESPHIVTVHDHGEQDGGLFLVTQLVTGGDLATHLEQHGRMTPSRAVALVLQVLEGLDDAHRVGVVHRDVKPSNVLLRSRGQRQDAVLCDFGIAVLPGAAITRTGQQVGSLPYMAPERHTGGAEVLPGLTESAGGVAGDVYSVGCLLWQTLTGSPPYAGSDVEIALAHLQALVPQLPDPSSPFARGINEVLERAMAKRPQDRYASAAAMRDALAAVAASAPARVEVPEQASIRHAVALGAPTVAPTSEPRRRRRPLLAAALGLALVLGTGTVVAVAAGDDDPTTTAGPGPTPTAPTATVTDDGADLRRGEVVRPGDPRTPRAGERPGRQGRDRSGPLTPERTAAPGTTTDNGPGDSSTKGTRKKKRRSANPTAPGTPGPTRQPSSPPVTTPPPAPPTPTYKCWNNKLTFGASQCPAPTGQAGLRWVFYTVPFSCRSSGTPGPRRSSLECTGNTPYGKATVILTEWTSVAAASSSLSTDFGNRPVAWRDGWGYQFDTVRAGQNVSHLRANLYSGVPMSARMSSGSAKAEGWLVPRIGYRNPANLRGAPR